MMSAILSVDDLNDFISPGVACIKPVETLPLQKPDSNPYEVTTEDKLSTEPPPPAQISLTDCLACSGCVTSAEAVLVSLQSYSEVLKALESAPSIFSDPGARDGKIFVASVSPQVRASLAATYGVTESEAGWMIQQLLSGPFGIGRGESDNSFTWVVDTNAMRELLLVMSAEEVLGHSSEPFQSQDLERGNSPLHPKKPILTSVCPGWICYAEKTHPYVLPHLSRLKSPQALTGTLLKTILSKFQQIDPSRIWHLAIMPCFDKKLEASRQELTDFYWRSSGADAPSPVRDVDCVITARELLMLANSRGISFPSLPRQPPSSSNRLEFPDPIIERFVFPSSCSPCYGDGSKILSRQRQSPAAGSSGGYLYHVLLSQQSLYPGSTIITERGRNSDVVDYSVLRNGDADDVVFHAARYYGFRNIQNLVRRLKPAKKSRLPVDKSVTATRKPEAMATAGSSLDYAEVMACPGGCTNGGGQIKLDDLGDLQGKITDITTQKEWLDHVDEAYYSMEEDARQEDADLINGISHKYIKDILTHWAKVTDIDVEKLIYTSYRQVKSDVGKTKGREAERVVELASKIGGGW